MGILRVDKLSGLETPTAITSSVYFDGDARNDNLNMAADYHDLDFQNTDFTFESWVYPTDMSVDRYWCSKGDGNLPGTAMDVRLDSDGQIRISFYVSSTSHQVLTSSGVLQENVWSHVAVVRSGTSFKCYVNGKETASETHDITISDVSATFKIGILEGVGTGFKGYMSDFRFVRGKAVYTEEFTPPVYALEPIDGTVLLCCNNPDSAAAVSLAGIGTSKIIVVNGDVSIASTNPGSLKDFTYGTEFKGVTTFDTQGYFVPPSGTTTDRDRTGGRGLVGGGEITPASESESNHIDFITISSTGNSQAFGDLSDGKLRLGASGSSTRGIFAGGKTPSLVNVMEFVTIAAEGNAVDFGDLANPRDELGGAGNNIRALFFTGSAPGSTKVIEYVNTAALGNAQTFGELTRAEVEGCGCGSPTRGILFIRDNSIDYVTWATTGNAQDFGDTGFGENGDNSAASDSTRAIIAGGAQGPSNAATGIHYTTISTLGNTQEFGDLTAAAREGSGMSNSIRGVFSLGIAGGSQSNAMDYVTIQTTGNAKDFGDLTPGRIKEGSACSDSHGAIG